MIFSNRTSPQLTATAFQEARSTTWLAVLAVLLCWNTSLWAQENPEQQKAGRPNIVLIISDDQAWTDYGFMGHSEIETPNLDRLAKSSALFRRGYTPVPLCRPSLMSMVTGQYPFQHRMTGNDPFVPKGGDAKVLREQLIANIDGRPVLPKLLSDAGYLTHQSGKWWEGSFQRGGFTAGMTRGFPEPGGRHGDDGLKIGREGMQPVLSFIDDAVAQRKPFFVWYAPFLPHRPHNPPARLEKKYSKKTDSPSLAKYYACCDWFDETCGQLIDHIDQKGLGDSTLIVYVTDNGWVQDPKAAGYLPRSKRSVFEGGVRTPIMYRWTGKISPTDRPELATTLDLFPTLLAAAQVKDIPENSGLNLLPNLVAGDAIQRTTLFGEAYTHDVRYLDQPEESLSYRYCIDRDWKLIVAYDGPHDDVKVGQRLADRTTFLFNLKNDPTESTNLAAKHPEIVQRLSQSMHDWNPLHIRKPLTDTPKQ